jgi:hypothetical protein
MASFVLLGQLASARNKGAKLGPFAYGLAPRAHCPPGDPRTLGSFLLVYDLVVGIDHVIRAGLSGGRRFARTTARSLARTATL